MKKVVFKGLKISSGLVALLAVHLILSIHGRIRGDEFSSRFAEAEGFTDGGRDWLSESEVSAILSKKLSAEPEIEVGRLAKHILKTCRFYGYDPAFILSMIQVESGFRPEVHSKAGAIGLMQLMPETAAAVARRHVIPYRDARSLLNPYTSVSLGVAYLSDLRRRYRGESAYFPVAAYNLGPTKLDLLRKKPKFKPEQTRTYFEKIRQGVPTLRFFGARGTV